MLNEFTEKYLIEFLLGQDNKHLSSVIVYRRIDEIKEDDRVIIVRSKFFDEGVYMTPLSMPNVKLNSIGTTPVLFGGGQIEYKKSQVIIHGDIIASAYYLMSRYEEVIRYNIRDKHGRFIGKESTPYINGFITRPIVDEYGKILRDILRKLNYEVLDERHGFSSVLLTHDVDIPWEYFSLKKALRRVGGILKRTHRINIFPILNVIGKVENDPLYTFQFFFDNDRMVPSADIIYFIKSGGAGDTDIHNYINDKALPRLLDQIHNNNGRIGYHVSYVAGGDTELIANELHILREIDGSDITDSRNHYLRSCEPKDYDSLIKNGITDDYTMGYADVCGFRLGTCRPAKWINPQNGMVTSLTLHHLTIMERTLLGSTYMGLQYMGAFNYAKLLIDKV